MEVRSEMKRWLAVLVIALSVLVAACGGDPPAGGSSDGQTLLETRCTACHSLTRVTSVRKTEAQWRVTVTRMVQRGARLSPEEENTLLTYLAQTYGK